MRNNIRERRNKDEEENRRGEAEAEMSKKS